MCDLAEYITGLVREQLKRMPAFADTDRDTFDNIILADLENAIRRQLGGETDDDAGTWDEGYDAGWDAAMERVAEQRAKKAAKKKTEAVA
jgi:hypothetical protein